MICTVKRSLPRPLGRASLVVLTLVFLCACAATSPGVEQIATWDGGALERDDYRAWVAWQGLEPSEESIRNLVLIVSMAAEARKYGATGNAEVQLEAEAMRQRILLPALNRHLDAQVSIADEEIEQLRVSYPEAFQQPRKLFLRGIYKRHPDGAAARASVRQHMQELRSRVVGGADLEQLAAEESESQSRFRKGSIGFVAPETLPEVVRLAVKDLQPGDVSSLIELPDGIAFYACERIKPARQPDSEEIRRRFRQNLFRQKREALGRLLRDELTARVEVTLDQDPVLIVGRYTLPANWMGTLVRQRLGKLSLEDLASSRQRRLLREWGLRVAMADHARFLGLTETEPNATALGWRQDQALALHELRRRVDARLQEPDEDELLQRFEQRRHRLSNPPAYRVAAIQFTRAGETTDVARIDQARDALARIRAGSLGFDQAARAFSRHSSARMGGQLGWLTRQQLGSLDVGLLSPMRQLSPGEDTGLLRLQSGLWLVKLIELREAEPMTFEQAREQLAEAMKRQRIDRLQAEVRRRQLSKLNLQILAN